MVPLHAGARQPRVGRHLQLDRHVRELPGKPGNGPAGQIRAVQGGRGRGRGHAQQ